MIHFWMMSDVGLVPFKMTDVIVVWTSLSILSVCACLPPQNDDSLKDRDAFCLCVSALSTEPGTHSVLDICPAEGHRKSDLEGS